MGSGSLQANWKVIFKFLKFLTFLTHLPLIKEADKLPPVTTKTFLLCLHHPLSSSGRCCVKVCKEAPTPTLSSARASRLSASRAFCSSGRMAPTTPHARTLLWGRHQPHPDCSLKGMRALLTSPDSAAACDLPPPPSPRLSSLHVHNTPTTHSLFSAPLAATSWPFSFPLSLHFAFELKSDVQRLRMGGGRGRLPGGKNNANTNK